jgi:hypothetical protein
MILSTANIANMHIFYGLTESENHCIIKDQLRTQGKGIYTLQCIM